MKYQLPALLLLGATTTLLSFAGCSDDAKKGTDPVAVATAPNPGDAAAPTPSAAVPADPFAEISAALAASTRDTTATLATPQTNLNLALDTQIAAWKATGATSTPMNEEKLTLARTDFAQKLKALPLADAATWDNAKGEATTSLQNLRRVYGEYLAARK